MNYRWVKGAFVALLILSPFLLALGYRRLTAPPKEIVLAAGPEGGRFLSLSRILADEIYKELEVKVHVLRTDGSLENLAAVVSHKADIGFYQAGTLEMLQDLDPGTLAAAGLNPQSAKLGDVAFIANLYSQPTHVFVRRGSGIKRPSDLKGKTVHLGLPASGTYPMSLVVLEHFGLNRDEVTARHMDYAGVKQGFLDGSLDAAIIQMGVRSPIFPELFETGNCSLLDIPNAEALALKHAGMSRFKIPAGLYGSGAPEKDIQTVALQVELITRSDVHSGFVEEVTRIILAQDFTKRSGLRELFAEGRQFAQAVPDFPIHRGALKIYSPGPRPLLPSEFVEATEGIRSFIFAVAIAVYLGVRRLRRRKIHKLDRYIQSLLHVEQEQHSIGTSLDVDDTEKLRKLLVLVDRLKNDAFRTFTAHEINEDRAISCFIQMCDGVTDKINSKMSRQRLHRKLDEIGR